MGRAALSAHALSRADQPGMRLVLRGGSGGGGEEGGAGHALARRARKETEVGGTRAGASRRRRVGVKSAGGLALAVANQPPPRAQCLAPRAVLHHARVRWAAAGYKRLRPSGRPPFWGSFKGKLGCSVAWMITFFPRTGGPGKRRGNGFIRQPRSVECRCVLGRREMARGTVLRQSVLITSFSFCVLFLPQVEFSRRKTGRPSGKQTSLRNILSP